MYNQKRTTFKKKPTTINKHNKMAINSKIGLLEGTLLSFIRCIIFLDKNCGILNFISYT
jgi:hypothetical protein